MAANTNRTDSITRSIGPSTAQIRFGIAGLIFFAGVVVLGLWLAATLPGEDQLFERVLVAVIIAASAAYLGWTHLQHLAQRVSCDGVCHLTVYGMERTSWLDVEQVDRRGSIFVLHTRSSGILEVDPRRFDSPEEVAHLVRERVPVDAEED